MTPRDLLLGSFGAAVSAADPMQILPAALPPPPRGKTLVVGAGKAAGSMARAVEAHWPAEAPLGGLVITRYEHGWPTTRIEVVEAGHPVPDESGERAALRILEATRALGPDDLLLALVSGGGSSLLALPVEKVPMADLKTVTRALLHSGAPIQEMNTVRKHLSRIQGGRLAEACRAEITSLVISDVTGDDPTHIASGPTVPDPTTYRDALHVLKRHRVTAPESVQQHLTAGANGHFAETPKPGHPAFARAVTRVVATAHKSLMQAATYFQHRGVTPVVLGDSVTGEAREVARVYAALTRQIRHHHHPFQPPVALISGGECTVTIPPSNASTGRGGRCSEFLLSLAIELGGLPQVWALAADTDGIDGSERNAGAVLTPDALARADALDVSARQHLDRNDSYGFFAATSDLLVTGPTRTNVNDYRAILIL